MRSSRSIRRRDSSETYSTFPFGERWRHSGSPSTGRGITHYDPQVGAKSVTLTIGSRAARVDTNEILLEGPLLEIKDVLYVPLRFFTDVLGAQAQYDRRHNSVSIVAQLVGRSTNGLVPVAGGFARFGTVVAVDVLLESADDYATWLERQRQDGPGRQRQCRDRRRGRQRRRYHAR